MANDPRDFSITFVFVDVLKNLMRIFPKKLYTENFTDEDYNLGHNVVLLMKVEW